MRIGAYGKCLYIPLNFFVVNLKLLLKKSFSKKETKTIKIEMETILKHSYEYCLGSSLSKLMPFPEKFADSTFVE